MIIETDNSGSLDSFARRIQEKTDKAENKGILTLEEIANGGESYMEFYNKTCVVGVLGKP